MFQSYRNQSVDLQSKSTDWFLLTRFYMMGTLVVNKLKSNSEELTRNEERVKSNE